MYVFSPPLALEGEFFLRNAYLKIAKTMKFALKCKLTHTKYSPNGSPKTCNEIWIF